MPEKLGQKIIAGLRDAIRHSRCSHEYTYWANRGNGRWWRICTKCKVTEWRVSQTEPSNRG